MQVVASTAPVDDDDLLPISALEHLLYCPRQCALIHVDGVWIENGHTAAGRVVHDKVDRIEEEHRPGIVVVRAAMLRSTRLGLKGIADAVEFTRGADERWQAYPVEYKRGARQRRAHDDVQLCAQAMCLEEMTGMTVPEGAIFHAKSQRRRVVALDPALRTLTEETAARLRAMVRAREVPPPVNDARCEECSLREACRPELPPGARSLALELREALR